MTAIFYTFCIPLDVSDYMEQLSKLPKEMRIKNGKFKRWQDAHAHLYGKLLLEVGLEYYGINRSLKELLVSKYGKPYFANQNFSFNISHSGEYVVCIISKEEPSNLGIDLEQIKPIPFQAFEKIWTQKEKKSLIDLQQFYTYWTRKEAIIKADGLGMQIPLNEIEVTSLQSQVGDKEYYLKHIFLDKEYKMHIASITKLEAVNLIQFSFNK